MADMSGKTGGSDLTVVTLGSVGGMSLPEASFLFLQDKYAIIKKVDFKQSKLLNEFRILLS